MSTGETRAPAAPQIESINAATLATHDMARAVRFYSVTLYIVRAGIRGWIGAGLPVEKSVRQEAVSGCGSKTCCALIGPAALRCRKTVSRPSV